MKETILLTDGYKLGHHFQYPKGIENLSKNFNHVWFTNSYKDWKNLPENVTMIKVI